MQRVLNCLLCIVEKPSAEKCYMDLKKSYESLGMTEEAELIDLLIQQRFHAEHSDILADGQ